MATPKLLRMMKYSEPLVTLISCSSPSRYRLGHPLGGILLQSGSFLARMAANDPGVGTKGLYGFRPFGVGFKPVEVWFWGIKFLIILSDASALMRGWFLSLGLWTVDGVPVRRPSENPASSRPSWPAFPPEAAAQRVQSPKD